MDTGPGVGQYMDAGPWEGPLYRNWANYSVTWAGMECAATHDKKLVGPS